MTNNGNEDNVMCTNCLVCNKQLTKKQTQKKQKTCSRECYRNSIKKGYDDTFMDHPTEFSDYFLGLWTAIGHINKKEARLKIETAKLDLVTILKEGSKYTNRVEEYERKGCAKTYVLSYAGALSRRIQEIGYAPGKKKGKEIIPNEIYNNKDRFAIFLRGFFDAKNAFYNHETHPNLLQLRFSSMSEEFLLRIENRLKELKIILGGTLINITEKNTFRLSFFHDDSIAIGQFIYNNATIKGQHNYTLYLKHKDNQIGRIYEYGYNIDFLNIFNDFSCYFIGLFTADGCIDSTNFHTILELTDNQIIYDIAKKTNYINKIPPKIPTGLGKKLKYRLDFGLPVTNSLTLLGYRPGIKTGKEHVPDTILCHKEYFKSFLRGFSDGDGSFYIVKKENSLGWSAPCANKVMLTVIWDKLKELKVVYGGCLSPIKTDGLPMWSLSFKHQDAITLGDFLYENETICLKRKKAVYLQGKKKEVQHVRQQGNVCSTKDCNVPAHCKGLCKRHYMNKHNQKPERKVYMRKYMREYKRKKKLETTKNKLDNSN